MGGVRGEAFLLWFGCVDDGLVCVREADVGFGGGEEREKAAGERLGSQGAKGAEEILLRLVGGGEKAFC